MVAVESNNSEQNSPEELIICLNMFAVPFAQTFALALTARNSDVELLDGTADCCSIPCLPCQPEYVFAHLPLDLLQKAKSTFVNSLDSSSTVSCALVGRELPGSGFVFVKVYDVNGACGEWASAWIKINLKGSVSLCDSVTVHFRGPNTPPSHVFDMTTAVLGLSSLCNQLEYDFTVLDLMSKSVAHSLRLRFCSVEDYSCWALAIWHRCRQSCHIEWTANCSVVRQQSNGFSCKYRSRGNIYDKADIVFTTNEDECKIVEDLSLLLAERTVARSMARSDIFVGSQLRSIHFKDADGRVIVAKPVISRP